jgi:Lar family restriction alleviation protein
MTTKIKQCPFCGSLAALIDAPEAGNEGAVVVECNNCRASGPVVFGVKDDPKPRAIELWNQRAS